MSAVFQFTTGSSTYSISKDLLFGWSIDIGNGFTPIDHGTRVGSQGEIEESIKFLKSLEHAVYPVYVPDEFKEAVRMEIARAEKLLVPGYTSLGDLLTESLAVKPDEAEGLLRIKDTAVLSLAILTAMKVNADGTLMADLDYVIVVKGKPGQRQWMVCPRDADSKNGFDTIEETVSFILRRWW